MAAASAEPHPSSPARPPSLSPAPKLLPRDKQTRRQGRPSPALPPPRRFPPPTPPRARLGSGFRVATPAPSPRGRVRAAASARKALPPSLPPSGARHFRAGPDQRLGLNVAAAVCAGPWATIPAGSASRAESRLVRTPPPRRPSPPRPSVKLSLTKKPTE